MRPAKKDSFFIILKDRSVLRAQAQKTTTLSCPASANPPDWLFFLLINYFVQYLAEGREPNVRIPVSATIPCNQAKIEKPSKEEAVVRHFTRMAHKTHWVNQTIDTFVQFQINIEDMAYFNELNETEFASILANPFK